MSMSDPVYSPDGKFMWTGSEWIPAPPEESSASDNRLKMQDSVIGGDVVQNTVINNDPAAVTSAVIMALKEFGVISEDSTPAPIKEDVELPPSFKIGDHVEYHSPTNMRWIDRCTVVATNDDGTYRIQVPKDGGVVETKHAVVIGTAPGTIRPAALPFVSGDRVMVNWKNHGNYYPGVIAKENDNHTFLIQFDDGDLEDNVEWHRIERIDESDAEVQEYIEVVAEAERELIEAFEVFDTEGKGTITANLFFEILTTMGDNPLSTDDVLETFAELNIQQNSEVNYREIARWMVNSYNEAPSYKTEVVIRDARLEGDILRGFAYDHPKLGEGPVKTTRILDLFYDERATARVETLNTIYVVGPTGWRIMPDNHPFRATHTIGEIVKVEWGGTWWDARIIDARDGQYLITYTGFDSSWDEWVTAARIKV